MPTAKPKTGACKGAAAHRRSQAKYVDGHKSKHAAAVKRNYTKNRGKILADKKQARKGKGKSRSSRKIGRPRKCG